MPKKKNIIKHTRKHFLPTDIVAVDLPGIKERVRAAAKREHLSMSAFIRRATESYLKAQRAPGLQTILPRTR